MAYTEFRKSYGDFEIVIPAIDFSKLNNSEAIDTIKAMLEYEQPINHGEWLCHHLERNKLWSAERHIRKTIDPTSRGIESFIKNSMGDAVECPILTFHPMNPAGRVLRIEWCKHMAKEIEREFGL